MILVTVGTEKFAFNRLMKWIDNLIANDLISVKPEEIVIQYGSCTLVPERVKGYSVLKETEFLGLVQDAELIIAHCGEGTIDLLACFENKPFILVPRQIEHNEHVDDHQMELAEELEKQGIPIAYSEADLAGFIAEPVRQEFPTTPAAYYTKASSILEARFETDEVKEQLLEDLLGNSLADLLEDQFLDELATMSLVA